MPVTHPSPERPPLQPLHLGVERVRNGDLVGDGYVLVTYTWTKAKLSYLDVQTKPAANVDNFGPHGLPKWQHKIHRHLGDCHDRRGPTGSAW